MKEEDRWKIRRKLLNTGKINMEYNGTSKLKVKIK